jgi:immune inhibitor A
MRIIYTILLLFIYQQNNFRAFAVQAYPYPISITQPDGTTLMIQLNGNEFQHYQTSEDGYLLQQNAKGYYTYATINSRGKIISSENIASDIKNRSAKTIQFLKTVPAPEIVHSKMQSVQKSKMALTENKPRRAFPVTGSGKSLVILVNFSDNSFLTAGPQTAFNNLLNQENYSDNGATGSAREYFMASSYGKFSPNFDVVGPYTLPQNLAYYGANDASGYDLEAPQLIADACNAANTAGLDFTQYDVDNNSVIDNVFVYYAGYNEAEGGAANTIWPHRWTVQPGYNYSGTTASVTYDGKVLEDYACTSELKSNSGTNMCGIGTFCHEFGHVLGLPDYYHTTANKSTLGTWSIMSSGNYNNGSRTPPTYSVFDRFYLGYLQPDQCTTASDLNLIPLYQGKTEPINTNNQCYLLSASTHNLMGNNPNPTEFFMLEYRKKVGWDSYLPAEGLCIWHIDYDQTAWDDNSPNNYTGASGSQSSSSHLRVYLQPLSGSTTTPGTAFTTGSFTPTTWAGTDINRAISAISSNSSEISFKLMGGTPPPTIMVGNIENLLQFPNTKISGTKTKTLNIKTTSIISHLNLLITGTDASLFSVSSPSLTEASANAAEGVDITVSYSPTISGNHTAILTISGGGISPDKVITLTGVGM